MYYVISLKSFDYWTLSRCPFTSKGVKVFVDRIGPKGASCDKCLCSILCQICIETRYTLECNIKILVQKVAIYGESGVFSHLDNVRRASYPLTYWYDFVGSPIMDSN